MGEGGAAPVHTVSAALQDALAQTGIIISDSHNNAESIFQALRGHGPSRLSKSKAGQPNDDGEFTARTNLRAAPAARFSAHAVSPGLTYRASSNRYHRMRFNRQSLRRALGERRRGACVRPPPGTRAHAQ